jgi:N-acetylglucosaminyldiphosphoundecaprenol N-acetyl-beta-D-mannosaminyltransferase
VGAVCVDAVTRSECVAHVLSELAAGRGGWLLSSNLDHLRRCERDPSYRNLCRNASLVLADGMPLVWASRLAGTPLPERVAGSDLIGSLCAAASAAGRTVHLIGAAPGAADAAAQTLRVRHPGLHISGVTPAPPGFEHDAPARAGIRAALAAARPDLVFLGLPQPKADHLIAELRPALPAAWFMGVGIALSFLSGGVRRAPEWMRAGGLEWLHRLAQEPARLARRYLLEGIPFGLRLLGGAALRRSGATAGRRARPGG